MSGAATPPGLARRVDRACHAFEAAWRAGAPQRVEEAVSGWEGSDRVALLRELVPLDADYRRRRGENSPRKTTAPGSPSSSPAGWRTPRRTAPAGPAPAADVRLPPPRRTSPGTRFGRNSVGAGWASSALKVLPAGGRAGPAALARFLTEAAAVGQFQHPNVVQVHGTGEADGHPAE